ncbi:hypothetical protein N185_17605 [Sinorhizobium sp. GW3]|nr:hypothetical protein N185_17605 [Sinorhizobium sp. GW3]
MEKMHFNLVTDQFGPRADDYVKSLVHAQGPDLSALEHVASCAKPDRALDMGAGGGHVSYAMARHAKEVTACDISDDMLSAIGTASQEKGFANIKIVRAPAEQLPFEDSAFDFVASRYSAHHWRDFRRGISEARRVLEPGATAVFVDVVSAGEPMHDVHLQAVELLRDPSHIRDYSPSEWMWTLAHAGFRVRRTDTWKIRMDFPVWIKRMRTPEKHVVAIRSLQAGAAKEIRDFFAIEEDGSFLLDVALFEAEGV